MASPTPSTSNALAKVFEGRLPADYMEARLAREARYGFARVGGEHFWRFCFGHVMRTSLRLMLGVCGLSGRGRKNALKVTLVRVTHTLADLPEALDGLRILHIADTHADRLPEVIPVVARLVRDLDYDIAVHTGDFRERTHADTAVPVALTQTLLTSLKTPLYAVMGNHDLLVLVPDLEACGVRFLINEHVRLSVRGGEVYLCGVDDPYAYQSDDLKRAQAGIPAGAFTLLLAHHYRNAAQAAQSGISLMLCGHTHGGQVNPLGKSLLSPRSLGLWQEGSMMGYTSAGAGVSGVAARYNSVPEVTLHTLRRRA